MDVSQKYSNEALFNLMKKMNDRTEQVCDLMQLLMMSAEDGEIFQRSVVQGIDEIKKTTSEINSKMDIVLEKLEKLEADFKDLKCENRDIEQKIMLMSSKLSKMEGMIQGEEIEDYYAMAQSLYVNWEDFDLLTRKFLPLAEYLYSKLQKYDKPDYSPVILELCRAIENEFLLKIFKRYTMDLIDRKGSQLDQFFVIDRASGELTGKTGQFVKAIAKASKTKKPEYTLGQMNTILSLANDNAIVQKSPLLKDFVAYLHKNTEAKKLLDGKYIKKVNEIVSKYRNPSAHPEFMPIEKAQECRDIMPDRLDYLMECVIA